MVGEEANKPFYFSSCCSSLYSSSSSLLPSCSANAMAVESMKQQECCLCGDVGFLQDLLLCHTCGFRLQHTYCSRYYPNIDKETWRCEWCLYDEEKRAYKRKKAFEFLLEIAQSLPSPEEPPEKSAVTSPEEKKCCRKRYDDKRPTPKSSVNPKRKLNCNSSPSRVIGRRYKLLADVLC